MSTGATVRTPEEAIVFPAGLLGFPECTRFRLSSAGHDGLYWLESLEHEPLRFLCADPFVYFCGYAVDLAASDVNSLEAADSSQVAVLTIITLPAAGGSSWTANLQAPIALNIRRGLARQIVLNDPRVGVRCAFDPLRPAA